MRRSHAQPVGHLAQVGINSATVLELRVDDGAARAGAARVAAGTQAGGLFGSVRHPRRLVSRRQPCALPSNGLPTSAGYPGVAAPLPGVRAATARTTPPGPVRARCRRVDVEGCQDRHVRGAFTAVRAGAGVTKVVCCCVA
jgi:hypothetical protein